MATLILVGPLWSSDSQGSDLVREAKQQGHDIILVIPASETQPDDVHALATHLVRIEADAESLEAAAEAIGHIRALDMAPVAISPANECGVILAARIGLGLGLAANPEPVALALRDKSRQRATLEAAGFPTPRYACFTVKEELAAVIGQFQFPVVMKPVDGLGKVGVIKGYDVESLLNAFDHLVSEAGEKFSYCKMGGAWIVEEFIDGAKLTLELVAANADEIVPMVLTETTCVGDKFIEVGHALPSSLPRAELDAINQYGVNVLKAIGVCHGVVHLELIRRHSDGEIFVIELNGRIPGGRMSKLIEEASGNNYYRIVIATLLSGHVPRLQPFTRCVAVHWFCRSTGVVQAIKGFDTLDEETGFVEKFVRTKVGERTVATGDGFDRIGYSMNAANDLATAKERARCAAEAVELVYEA